jgi:4-amino-4-deoxy-L-arabinose transferase-like glycosyltransferase
VHRPALLLLFLSFVTFFVGLGRPAITDSDEAFYAEAAREMVQGGDWLTPHYNYVYRWQKPILYYWLTAVTYTIFGASEYAARLWSALSGVALAFMTWKVGRQLTARDDTGWLAGAVAATCFGYVVIARLALPDLPLALFITLAIHALFSGRWVLAGVAMGLGLATKGPVALAIPSLVFGAAWFVERPTMRAKDLGVLILAFAVVGLPWYAAMWNRHGMAYLESFFVGDNFERFATARFNEPRSIVFYVPIVIGGLVPWSAFSLLWVRPLIDVITRRRQLSTLEWRLLVWAGLPLLFFTISVGKQPRYILPVLPPLAILLARSIVKRCDERRGLCLPTVVTAALIASMAIVMFHARALFVTAYPPVTWMSIGALGAVTVTVAFAAASGPERRVVLVMPVCAAVTMLALQFGALSGIRPEPVEQMAALIRHHRTASEPVGGYQVFVRNLIFYTGFPQVEIFDDRGVVEFFRSQERSLLVINRSDLVRLEPLLGTPQRILGEVAYFNTANLKLRTVLSPTPQDSVEQVLLVSNR